MRRIGLQAIDQAPKTSKPHPEHRGCPYRLRDVVIKRPDHVWRPDDDRRRPFGHLCIVKSWFLNLPDRLGTRSGLASATPRRWVSFKPSFTPSASDAFTDAPTQAGVTVSMDGRGRFMDNIFIEGLWRSLKNEAVHLHDLGDGLHARQVIGDWLAFYNAVRPHSPLGGGTPCDACEAGSPAGKAIPLPAAPQTRQSREKTVATILAE